MSLYNKLNFIPFDSYFFLINSCQKLYITNLLKSNTAAPIYIGLFNNNNYVFLLIATKFLP